MTIAATAVGRGRGPESEMSTATNPNTNRLRVGMAGLGMIFDETYRPLFEQLHSQGLYRRDFGPVAVELAAVATRTGTRPASYNPESRGRAADLPTSPGREAPRKLLEPACDAACVATPAHPHFD